MKYLGCVIPRSASPVWLVRTRWTLKNAVSLEEIAKSTVALYAAGGADVSLRTSPCPPLRGDQDQLVQVLTNLIQNGLDAAGGGNLAKVAVQVEPQDPEHLAIIVSDNGPGVSEEMLPKLFEPYATTKPDGTGLGLAIVQRIAHEHGGAITYEKGAAGGAVFRAVLPVAGPTSLPEPAEDLVDSHAQPRG